MDMEEQRKKIIQSLEEKGAILPCPRCGNDNFAVVDGYFYQSIQPNINESIALRVGGPSIPSIAVICNRCGFIAQHAAGALGIMPLNKKSNDTTETSQQKTIA